MPGEPIRVLLIEDNLTDSVVTGRRILHEAPVRYQVTSVETLSAAWPILERDGADVVLADLNLPDSQGLDTLAALRAQVPSVPIVVLTGHSEQALGVRAVQMGAQDYLQKGRFDHAILQRSLRYAIERHRFIATLNDLSLLDPLTGLYNRRGLLALGGKRVEVARRLGCRAFIIFADLDGLKAVNDRHGHTAGDGYLQAAAEALKQSFRAADVVARLGGDEFVVLGLETALLDPAPVLLRIQRALERIAEAQHLPYPVSLSCGVERFDPEVTPMEEALQAADDAMYRVKRERREAN
jgi:diguanylate cyclase (GGDEF)-like protein